MDFHDFLRWRHVVSHVVQQCDNHDTWTSFTTKSWGGFAWLQRGDGEICQSLKHENWQTSMFAQCSDLSQLWFEVSCIALLGLQHITASYNILQPFQITMVWTQGHGNVQAIEEAQRDVIAMVHDFTSQIFTVSPVSKRGCCSSWPSSWENPNISSTSHLAQSISATDHLVGWFMAPWHTISLSFLWLHFDNFDITHIIIYNNNIIYIYIFTYFHPCHPLASLGHVIDVERHFAVDIAPRFLDQPAVIPVATVWTPQFWTVGEVYLNLDLESASDLRISGRP